MTGDRGRGQQRQGERSQGEDGGGSPPKGRGTHRAWSLRARAVRRRPWHHQRVNVELLDAGGGYEAGACNIGPAEIARRRRAGLMGIGIALVLAIALVVIDAPTWTRAIVFLPLASGIVSLEQVRRRFCVGFALAGLRNFGALGQETHVTDDADRAADRRAALVMVGYSSVIAAVFTVAFVLLPV